MLVPVLALFGIALASKSTHHSHIDAKNMTVPDGSACIFQYAESIPVGVDLDTNLTTTQSWLYLLESAQETIDIAAFYISLTGGDSDGQQIYDAILAAAQRGVQVRVAINIPSASMPDTDLYALLNASSNIQASWVNMPQLVGAGIIHTKFIVSDQEAFYVGSANLDWRSLTQVKELGAYVSNCSILAQDLEKTFEIYWLAGNLTQLPSQWPTSTWTSYSISNPAQVTFNNTPAYAYLTSSPPQFCPPNRTSDIDSIVDIMSAAQDTICIEVMDYEPAVVFQYPQYFWPVIDNAIRSAAFRGVQVSLLMGNWSNTSPKIFPYLYSLDVLSNVEVRLMNIPPVQPVVPYTRVNHAKFMATESTAFVSTSNWEGDYFISTAGVSMVTNLPAGIANLQGAFDRDWNSNYTVPLPPLSVGSCL